MKFSPSTCQIAYLQHVGSDFLYRGRALFGLLHQLTFLLARGREGGGRIGASFFPNLAEGRRARGGVDLLPVAVATGAAGAAVIVQGNLVRATGSSGAAAAVACEPVKYNDLGHCRTSSGS